MRGIVAGVDDGDGEGKVRIRIPDLGGQNEMIAAPVATLMTGDKRGTWFMPEPNDEVLIAFLQGDVNHPYILGYLWNGEQRPPETDRHKRVIKTVNGHIITIHDNPGSPQGDTGSIEIRDAHGSYILMENGGITIHAHNGGIIIDALSVLINGRPVIVGGPI
jgi:uncharacterized protein involved in type VI secretion and phage assembly